MFKQLGSIASMMKQAQEMQGRMQDVNDALRGKQVVGVSGGGMIKVEANGLGEILRTTIEASLVENGEREMIEDLLPAAINDAQAKAKQLHAEAMKELTSGMNLPGLDDALSQLTGANSPEG